MSRRRTLRNYVHVTDPETGAGVWLAPNTKVPDWAHEAITNPRAWNPAQSDSEPEDGAGVSDTSKPARGTRNKADSDGNGGQPVKAETAPVVVSPPPADATKPPPRGGAGSGRVEWAAYATANGVEVTDDLKSRDDIIAALELAGIPTEATS